jgi:hypothetical protein
VSDGRGKAILHGREGTRAAARYKAERGMFLLLMAARPKSCPFKAPGKPDAIGAGRCPIDDAYACGTLACLNMPAEKH